MSAILCKNMKFPNILKFHLYNILKSNYHVQHCRLYQNVYRSRQTYATAAFNYAVKKDTKTQSNLENINVNIGKTSLEKALDSIDWIVQHNGRILMKDVTSALTLINGKGISSTHGLYLLRSCKYVLSEPPLTRIELVNKIWNRFQEVGIQFDVKHYNALLDVHTTNNFKFNPSEILNSMEEQHIEPNKATCLLLMKSYCKDGNLSGASEILEYMKEKGFPANEDVFNHLIEGHLHNKDFSGATDMLEVMYSSNLKPSEETYTLLTSGYAASGDMNQMMSYLNGEKTNGMIISDRSYLKVIEALATSGNHKYVDDVLKLIKYPLDIRQELINSAIELIHKDCLDTAYKLVINSADSQFEIGVVIFIRQLIKTNKPVSQVVDFCNDILKKGFDNIFVTAARAATEYGNIECSTTLFQEMLAQGHPIRSSNFWRIFLYLKENKSSNAVWTVLEKMGKLGIPADFTLYVNYVFPALGVPEPQDVIQNIKKSCQCEQTAYDALFVHYCNLGKIDHALFLAETVPVKLSQNLDFKSFLNKCDSTKNSPQYIKILKYMIQNIELLGQKHNTELIKGKYLATLILMQPAAFETLMKLENISFSKQAMNACEQFLFKNNPSSLIFLKRLQNRNSETVDLTIDQEKQQLEYLLQQKPQFKAFLMNRIYHHIRCKNIDRVSELLSVYEKNEFPYTPLMLAQLITLYSFASDLAKTKETFFKLKENFPSFKLDVSKIFEYATFLINYAEYEETLQVFKDCLTEPYQFSNKEAALRNIKRFFAVACDTKDVVFVKNVQNILMPLSEVIGSKSIYLDPLVNVHLSRNDLLSAFEEYRNYLIKYGVPACLNNLLRKCIFLNDKTTLQNITDLTLNYTGKSFILMELAVAFIQTDNFSKAVSVIQSFNDEIDPNIIEEICLRLRRQSKLAELEQFINALKSLSHIDKEKLYLHLFRVCKDRNDYGKAVEIFNKLGDLIEPNCEIVHCVIDLLKKNNQPISAFLQSKISPDVSVQSEVVIKATENLIKYLKEENAEFALNELNGLKKGIIRSLSSTTLTNLIDICLKKNCVENLSSNADLMGYIIENVKTVLKPILEKYSASGEVEKLILLANFIPDFSLKTVGFNSYFAKAFITSGQPENLLSHLEERYDANAKFFSVTAFEELLKFPNLEDRLLQLSVKYMDNNFDLPITVIWAHFFAKENYNKADELFKIFSKTHRTLPVDRVDPKILREIRQNENLNLGQKYIHFINEMNLRQRVKERAYGTLLDVLLLKGKYDNAADLVLESEKLKLPLHRYNRSTLLTLKNALEKENKVVPFNIPPEDFEPNMS